MPPYSLSETLDTLPQPLTILLGVLNISIGSVLTIYGGRSFALGKYWGKTRGGKEGSAFIPGGVGGVLSGSTALGVLAALGIVGVSEKTGGDLGGVGIILMLSFVGIIGGALGGRIDIIGLTSLAILASFAATLLLTTTIPQIPLLARQILLSLFLPSTILLIHLPRTTSYARMILSAIGGSYGVVIGIDWFVRVGLRGAVGLLVVGEVGVGGGVGGGGEMGGKGLLTGWWILTAGGIGWQLWFGLNDVDSEWNTYLSSLIAAHSTPSRSGIFTPPPSLFQRFISLFRPNIESSKPKFNERTRSSRRGARGGRGVPWEEEEERINKFEGEEWNDDSEDSEDDDATLRESIRPARYSKSIDVEDAFRKPGERGEEASQKLSQPNYPRSIASASSNRTLISPSPSSSSSSSTSFPKSQSSYEMTPLSSPPLPPSLDGSEGMRNVPATKSLLLALSRVNEAQRLARGEAPIGVDSSLSDTAIVPVAVGVGGVFPVVVGVEGGEEGVQGTERRRREGSEQLWKDVERNLTSATSRY